MEESAERCEKDNQPQGVQCPAPPGPPPPGPKLWGIKQQDKPCCIVPQLFLGSLATESNKEWLDAENITHVLQVGRDLKPSHRQGLKYHHLSADDYPWQDLRKFFPDAFSFIDEARQAGGVLVHCLAGMSRSASLCIAYVMWKQQLSYLDARAVVWAARPIIRPNSGFVAQLKQFEVQLREMEAHGGSLELHSACLPAWDFECWRQSRAGPQTQRGNEEQDDQAEACGFAQL